MAIELAKTHQIDLLTGHVQKEFSLPFFTALLWTELLELNHPLSRNKLAYTDAQELLCSSGAPNKGYMFFNDLSQLPAARSKLYPADVDDTAVIAEALLVMGRLDNQQKEDVASLLMTQFDPTKNSFYVWIETDGQRKSNFRDTVVDLNVMRFLSNFESHKDMAHARIFDVCMNLSDNRTTGYYDNENFALWLKLRAMKVLPEEKIKTLFESNSSFLEDQSGISTEEIIDDNPISAIEKLKYAIKQNFEYQPLFRHIGQNIGYIYPGPYYNLGLVV
jgi:hypothetical protein